MAQSWLVAIVCCLALAGCAGKGAVSWPKEVKPVIDATCVHCHNPATIDGVIGKACMLDIADGDPDFAAAQFRPAYLTKLADVAATDAMFAQYCAEPGAPRNAEKDRLIFAFKSLKELLVQAPPPDYTSEDAFVLLMTTRNKTSYEGCEALDLLDKGNVGSVDGMPPLWATRVMELLGETYTPATEVHRAVIIKYIESLLPYGRGSCTGGTGGS